MIKSDYMEIRDFYYHVPPHFNSELEIIRVFNGSIAVVCDNVEILVGENEVMLIPPYHIHAFTPSTEDSKAEVYMFSYSSLSEEVIKKQFSIISHKKVLCDNEFLSSLDYLLSEWKKSDCGFVAKSIMYSLISRFNTGNNLVLNESRSDMVSGIIENVLNNYETDFSIEDLSKQFGISKKNLSNIFKNYIGVSFKDFINNIRVEKSKSLLRAGYLTITEIAYQCGFGSVRSFNRIFLKVALCTPSEYKNKYNK